MFGNFFKIFGISWEFSQKFCKFLENVMGKFLEFCGKGNVSKFCGKLCTCLENFEILWKIFQFF
jgi:hypothetical protein